ncbi:MAG: hypothetical protein JWQ07_4939 [Ramlibacter sp.]|nr:hypothetical protein [Ramlibacter sp.]
MGRKILNRARKPVAAQGIEDDKTIPPGTRTGQGVDSIIPYLAKALATKVPAQVELAPDRKSDRPGDADPSKSRRSPIG